ncbi:iron-containing alcohol dehydrogenase family protein [Streptacidiphilus fuscans]|uniref:Iron-containing alcohol dehydrogenase n=1 Tax=Streptacidiphilus fuscans TaxID=2789292 RepID=A0A931FIR4_9ACTN|nr:iron-containing alcohol dehydrogenase [Streptacidiphilus fuscans]MBF9072049.1 iron-containing alcohol dehydrogenase [Streptacidiphilus fuscans]
MTDSPTTDFPTGWPATATLAPSPLAPLSPFDAEPTGRTVFGPGSIARLPELIDGLGQRRAFVVTDPGIKAVGILDRVLSVLADAGLETGVYAEVGPNPSTANVDAGAEAARAFGPAVVVALGGGSSLDAAKGIALLVGNAGARAADADELWEAFDGLPLIAVPTTSGTGAETNGFGVIEDTAACRKLYIGHASVKPLVALLDPELTLGIPAHITAATGIDALVHGVESLASRGANALSVAYATQAVTLVGHWLPAAYRDGADLTARSQLMLGAHLAGQALTRSGLGLVHGLGHAITAHTGTPHGVALAAVFEEVMAYNLDSAPAAYAQAAHALQATSAIDAVHEIAGAVDVKRPLRDLGVTADLLHPIATAALADAVTKNNPRTPTEAEILELLRPLL